MKSDLVLAFDQSTVSTTSVQKACYRFLEQITAVLEVVDDKLCCSMEFKTATGLQNKIEFEQRFRDEVLDNVLREKISLETEGLRNLVLGFAFSRSGIQDE